MADQKDKNEMTAEELLEQTRALYGANKYNEVIELLDDELLAKLKNDELYNYRGMAWNAKTEYDKAIEDYNKAITIDRDSVYLFNRGNIWRLKEEYDKAIEDYAEAIKLNPNDVDAYINKGLCWYEKNEYAKSLEDYNEAIRLDPNNAIAYNDRGVSWDEIEEFDKAITDYNQAIKLNPNYTFAYNNRGVSKQKKGDYELALADYNTAINLSPDYIIAKNNRDKVTALLGKKVPLDKDSLSSLQLFVRILEDIEADQNIKDEILKTCAETQKNAIDKIRAHAGSNIKDVIKDNKVVHYTKLKVADILASSENPDGKLRYYNAVYMNDPEEGIVLLDCMSDLVKQCYFNAAEQEEDNIYIGSFLPALMHEDELVMWRTYGKDTQGVEGGGCSIVINTDFFDKYKEKGGYINPGMTIKDISEETESTPQCLYGVLYYNKNHNGNTINKFDGHNGAKVEKDVEKLDKHLKRLVRFKKKLPKGSQDAIDIIIYHLLSEVRFFFKSADYKFENEVRVLQFVPKNSKQLIIDKGDLLPKKVFIESNKAIQPHIEKIILGPKVPNPKQWMYLDVALRKQNPHRSTPIDVSISECRYQ